MGLAGVGARRAEAVQHATVLAAALAAGAVLRFVLLERHSFWYDEAISAELARASALDLATGRVRDLGNPPLHPILLGLWGSVFGAGDASLRAFSATLGIAGIPLLFLVARRLVSQRCALIAAAILALSPVHVYFGQEARAYTLVATLCLASYALLLHATRAPRKTLAWVGYAITTFLAVYTHYFAFFVVLAQCLHVLFEHRAEPILLRRFALALTLAALAYGTWLPSFWVQATAPGNLSRAAETWYLHIAGTPLVWSAGTTLVWKDNPSPLRLAAAAVVALGFCAAVVAGALALRRERPALRLLLLWMLLPVVLPALISVLLFPFYFVRYGLLASPAFYILAAVGIARVPLRGRAALLLAVLPASAASLVSYYALPAKHEWRDAAAHVLARARPSDVIAFDADLGETPFARYGAGAQTRVRLLPPAGPTPPAFSGTGADLGASRDMTSTVLAGERVWLILSDTKLGSGGHYEALFERQWTRIESRKLRGVEVRLYERRRPPRTAGLPPR